jgi:UDP-glucuronate decarboxylase
VIIELSGSSSQIVHRPVPSDDPRQRRPDITRARQLIDWQPKVALQEGLLRTISYFEELLVGDRCALGTRRPSPALQPEAAD